MDDNPNVALFPDCYAKWHEPRGGSAQAWMDIFEEQLELHSMADGRSDVEFTAA